MMAEKAGQEVPPQSGDYLQVIDVLTNMFGQVMSSDAIYAVVDSCDGDLNTSIEVMMNIANDGTESTTRDPQNQPALSVHNTNELYTEPLAEPVVTQTQTTIQTQPSYSNMSKSTGAVPKKRSPPQQKPKLNPQSVFWNDQLRKILEFHNKGYKLLILMRGPPGCGKSHVAKQLVEMMVQAGEVPYRTHICSTDDYFMIRGRYVYNRDRLSDAHTWNQNRVRSILQQGLSPVIIDNTNVEIWEMQPYVRDGVKEGYYIEVIEPQTPWARNANELFKRNSHNVPFMRIRKMLDNYERGVTGEQLINSFGYSYSSGKVPPVFRVTPEIVHVNSSLRNREEGAVSNNSSNLSNDICVTQENATATIKYQEQHGVQNRNICPENKPAITHVQSLVNNDIKSISLSNQVKEPSPSNESASKTVIIQNTSSKISSNQQGPEEVTEYAKVETELLKKYIEVERQIEEFEKIEREWERGENWEENSKTTIDSQKNEPSTSTGPKPQRKIKSSNAYLQEELISTENEWQDWRNITRFMPDWNQPSVDSSKKNDEKLPDKRTGSTCIEIGDTDIFNVNNKYKVVTGTPRDINFYYMPREERMPNKRMLDKSSMTNDQLITEAYRCKNEEKHFVAFRKMFKSIARADLREIFDKCCGDVNWAVEIVLDGIASDQIEKLEEDAESDTDEIDQEQCECTAAYNIIPDVSSNAVPKTEPPTQDDVELQQPLWKKMKKDKTVSDSSMQLKKQIEQNVVIGDNHYSQHCLKIRKMRRGETEIRGDTAEKTEGAPAGNDASKDGLDKPDDESCPSTSKQMVQYDSDSDDESNNSEEIEEVTFNVGREFIVQLDDIFDRKGMLYPPNIVPVIRMPISILNSINALWIESMSHQIETQALYSEILLKQDIECARMIHEKEQELSLAGEEPEVPDFKELMDMEYAMMLYQKDISEWKNKEPNDMAARMTREKLFNLFPDVESDTLSQLLMAHDNNFQATVEILLASTGKTEILEEKNGINKFVMEKEMERQQKILEEEKKKAELSEAEWPMLGQTAPMDMGTVDSFRREAQMHLERRNHNYNKAQDCIRRGMTQVATYYTDVAAFHKKKFEQANSMAATSLIQVNAANKDNTTLDLHYLFVAEAIEALDLFLDHHIQKLRDSSGRHRLETLFLVTGRGVHSLAGPRIKPAVKRRLKERGLPIIRNLNPGSVAVDVRGENKLTHEIEAV